MTPGVLVTRPAEQSAVLERMLAAHGIQAVCVPTVSIDASSSTAELDAALDALPGADWLVITSQNGADALVRRIARRASGLPVGTRVAAVGPATAATLSGAGIRVDHVPREYLTVAIADGLGEVAGRRVVLARADTATRDLSTALAARGAVVEEVIAYRTIESPPASRDALREALHGHLAGITFSSGSTVRGLLGLASALDFARARALPAFCIGPVTAEVARRNGFGIAAVADPHTAEALANAVAAHFGTAPPS